MPCVGNKFSSLYNASNGLMYWHLHQIYSATFVQTLKHPNFFVQSKMHVLLPVVLQYDHLKTYQYSKWMKHKSTILNLGITWIKSKSRGNEPEWHDLKLNKKSQTQRKERRKGMNGWDPIPDVYMVTQIINRPLRENHGHDRGRFVESDLFPKKARQSIR